MDVFYMSLRGIAKGLRSGRGVAVAGLIVWAVLMLVRTEGAEDKAGETATKHKPHESHKAQHGGAKENIESKQKAEDRDHVLDNEAGGVLPFWWTMFLFILFNNLLGLVRCGASGAASIYVTGALAVVVFFAIHGSAIAKMGFIHYVESLWPHMDLPLPVVGILIKVL